MGNLIWHELSRYIALVASAYAIWASFWGFYFRKFFWDFIGGILRNPGGLQPSPKLSFFITIIVKVPVVQILTMILGFTMIALEYPLPRLRGTALQRSMPMKTVLLFFQAFLAVLFYQGTNAAIYSLVAVICYTRAQMLGEVMKEAKENRGKAGRV